MSFRKRNVAVIRNDLQSSPAAAAPPAASSSPQSQPQFPVPQRTTHQTTSTGTPSLDTLLSRPAGLPLGSSLLLLEQGATDFAGALVRISAAEGLARGEVVHVVGADPSWTRSLPALVPEKSSAKRTEKPARTGADAGARDGTSTPARDREMKIAWRYETFGTPAAPAASAPGHTFDLTKRLELPADAQLHYHALSPPTSSTTNPFKPILLALQSHLANEPTKAHRILLPALLSPAVYPPSASHPATLLPFLHALRGLLRTHARTATATIALSTALHPRSSGLLRWAEHLADSVLELAPFPHRLGPARSFSGADTPGRTDDEPQGMLRVLKVCAQERGSSGEGLGEDWAFVLSRRAFRVVRYTLPVDEEEAQSGGPGGMPAKADMEF